MSETDKYLKAIWKLRAACESALARLEPFTKMHSPQMVDEVRELNGALDDTEEFAECDTEENNA